MVRFETTLACCTEITVELFWKHPHPHPHTIIKHAHLQSHAVHTHINNGSWKYLLAACILLAQRWSEVHLLKETHAPFLSHCCSGYPVGPLMTLLQAGCNVWGPQQSCTRASAKPWEENKGWWKTRRKEYKEKRQLVTRTHSITLTMHLQPVCVCCFV